MSKPDARDQSISCNSGYVSQIHGALRLQCGCLLAYPNYEKKSEWIFMRRDRCKRIVHRDYYLPRTNSGQHVEMAIQSGHKAIHSSRTRGYNDTRDIARGVAGKSGLMRRRWECPGHQRYFCRHHTILNIRNSLRKKPFFFFFVEGGALGVCKEDGR